MPMLPRDLIESPEYVLKVLKEEEDRNLARNRRMDKWYLTYQLIDEGQLLADEGRERFISNDPMTIVDRSRVIITREEPQIQVVQPIGLDDDVLVRSFINRLEPWGHGVMLDIDQQTTMRGEMRAREVAAFHALVRGRIAARLIFQDVRKNKRARSPVNYLAYDPRFCYPIYDHYGITRHLYKSAVTLAELFGEYPDLEEKLYKDGIRAEDLNLGTLVHKIEYFDLNQYCVVVEGDGIPYRRGQKRIPLRDFAVEPYKHELGHVPILNIGVNQVPVRETPDMPSTLSRLPLSEQTKRLTGMQFKDYIHLQVKNGWLADQGRSILAAIESLVPQYNRMVSTIMQIVSNEAYGTWVIQTPSGEPIEFEAGNNAFNFLRLTDKVEKISPHTSPPDLTALLGLFSSSMQRGTISFILYGDTPFQGSGFLHQQVHAAALAALHDYLEGVNIWGKWILDEATSQYMGGRFRPFSVTASTGDPTDTYVKVSWDPKEARVLDFTPEWQVGFRLSLPSDILQRTMVARQLTDPRKPLISTRTAQERLLFDLVQDPDGESNRIFEDLANMNPVILAKRLRMAAETMGYTELAAELKQMEGDAVLASQLQRMLLQLQHQQVQQAMGGVLPETAPPESMGQTLEGELAPVGSEGVGNLNTGF